MLLVAANGCQTQIDQQPSQAAASQHSQSTASHDNPETSVAVVSTRDMVLLYQGNQDPGAGWELKTPTEGAQSQSWERRLTVKVDVSKATFPGWPPAEQGEKFCSLSVNQLGALPEKICMGPFDRASGWDTGETVTKQSTSSGVMIMLIVKPADTVLRWVER